YLATAPERVRETFAQNGLTLVGGFLFEPFHDPAAHGPLTEKAHNLIDLVAASGGKVLVLIDHISPPRERSAGRADAAPRLAPDDFAAMTGLMADLTTRAADKGVAAVIHHHAATYIEFDDEVDRVMEAVPQAGICVDTGHAAFSSVDPIALVERYGSRVRHIHLKDIDSTIRDKAVADACGFDEAVSRGVFVPLGRGVVDFAAFAAAAEAAGYEGFATIEQDMDPTMSAPDVPLAAAKESLEFLVSAHPAYRVSAP
ncbi:MAG: TIM barrel protein, partial [Pseudomonadota bacterium]